MRCATSTSLRLHPGRCRRRSRIGDDCVPPAVPAFPDTAGCPPEEAAGLVLRLSDGGGDSYLFLETGGDDLFGGLECLWFDEPEIQRATLPDAAGLRDISYTSPFVSLRQSALSGPVFLPDDPARRIFAESWGAVLPGTRRPRNHLRVVARSLLLQGFAVTCPDDDEQRVTLVSPVLRTPSSRPPLPKRLARASPAARRAQRTSTGDAVTHATTSSWITPTIAAVGRSDGVVAFYDLAHIADFADALPVAATSAHKVGTAEIVSISSGGTESIVIVVDAHGCICVGHLFDWLAGSLGVATPIRDRFDLSDAPVGFALHGDAPLVSVAVAPRGTTADPTRRAVCIAAGCGHAVLCSDEVLLLGAGGGSDATPTVANGEAGLHRFRLADHGSRFSLFAMSCTATTRSGREERCSTQGVLAPVAPTVVPLRSGFVVGSGIPSDEHEVASPGAELPLMSLSYGSYEAAFMLTADGGGAALDADLGIIRPEDVDMDFL